MRSRGALSLAHLLTHGFGSALEPHLAALVASAAPATGAADAAADAAAQSRFRDIADLWRRADAAADAAAEAEWGAVASTPVDDRPPSVPPIRACGASLAPHASSLPAQRLHERAHATAALHAAVAMHWEASAADDGDIFVTDDDGGEGEDGEAGDETEADGSTTSETSQRARDVGDADAACISPHRCRIPVPPAVSRARWAALADALASPVEPPLRVYARALLALGQRYRVGLDAPADARAALALLHAGALVASHAFHVRGMQPLTELRRLDEDTLQELELGARMRTHTRA